MKVFKIGLVFLIVLLFSSVVVSADNEQRSDWNYSYAKVDTAPGTDGFWTAPVNGDRLVFTTRCPSGTISMTITIRFMCVGDTDWTERTETYTSSGETVVYESDANIKWQAGVKSGEYSSGSLLFGWDL